MSLTFFKDAPALERRLEAGLALVCASPSAAEAGVASTDLVELSLVVKTLIVLLHQRAEFEDLLPQPPTWWMSRRVMF